jgi:hypothetical protein
MIDTDTIGLCQITQETLLNETVGQGECHISWVDISFVGNCCSEPPGWFVGPKTIILDVRTFSNDPKVKYHGTYDTDGFGVVIRNLSEADPGGSLQQFPTGQNNVKFCP